MKGTAKTKGFLYSGVTAILVVIGAILMIGGAAFDMVAYGPNRESNGMSFWAQLIGYLGIGAFGWGVVRFILQVLGAFRVFFQGRVD